MNDPVPSPQYTAASPTNTLAVVSLVTSILSWFLLPIIGGLIAVVTGHMARREIQNSFGTQSGDGLAIAGLVIGYIHLATYCVTLMLFVLFFGGMVGLSACAILAESASLIFSNDTIALLLSN